MASDHSVLFDHHPPLEEYLKTIELLNENGEPVLQVALARRLGRTSPAVSSMLERLCADGYVERVGRTYQLTGAGRTIALRVIRKHRLVERFLVDVVRVPWHLVDEEADRWEHVVSDEVEARLTVILGDPATCPHGNPIPGSANGAAASPLVQLSATGPGQRVRLERLGPEVEVDPEALRYLGDGGFTPGITATVATRAPDGTVVLDLGPARLALGAALCACLFVAVA